MTENTPASSRPREKLLHAKLMPPRLHAAAPRTDLLAGLDAVLTKKIALVTAPTGYGKTTLVSGWAAAHGVPAAWLTLDEYDNDPVRFWTYAISAIRTVEGGVGKAALASLGASHPGGFRPTLTSLINDLAALDRPCVLVLDDYHTITSPDIHEGLAFLLQHQPASFHLVLISRSQPSLPLGILRVREELVELDTARLSFSLPETEAFLREKLRVAPAPAIVETLQMRTEGWPAGLHLAALSLQGKNEAETGQFIQSFTGSHRYVADYLIKEVFEAQPPPVQDFLLKTCFLERLTGSLCDAVTGEATGQAMLEQIGRRGLFMTQLETGAERPWYRYNSLFAQSIQYLARQRLGDAAVQAILEKGGQWYEAHGLYEEAIQAALATRNFARAAALIERFIEIHALTELHTLGRWLEHIPEEELFRHPDICFAYAQVILYTSAERFAPATAARLEPFLSVAEKAWQEQKDDPRLGEVLSFRANVAWWQGDFQAAYLLARRSMEKLPEHNKLCRGTSLLTLSDEALNEGRVLEALDYILEARALLGAAQNMYGVLAANQILAEVFFWQGELEQAEQLNRQVLEEAVGEESMLDDQAIASLSLANIAYERNDLAQAERYAGRAVELAEQRGNDLCRVRATIRRAMLLAARNDYPAAHELAQSLVPAIQNPALLREVREAQAALSVQAGDLRPLAGWQTHLSDAKTPGLVVQTEREAFTLARWHLAQGKTGQALEILAGRAAEAAENGRVRSQATALCLEALAQAAAGDRPLALQTLAEALALGEAKGFRRLFLDEGARLVPLLQALLSMQPRRRLALYATTLLHSFDPGLATGQTVSGMVEPLSQQEQRVLRLLVAGLTNRDIAQELVVSTNTIKTHVKSIYRKLNISSRDEARSVARELKLS